MSAITFLLVDQTKFTEFYSFNRGWVAVDKAVFTFSLCRSIPEIFAIKVEICQKSRQILVVFALPNVVGATLPKLVSTLSPRHRAIFSGKVS